jgi:hypothetical protein
MKLISIRFVLAFAAVAASGVVFAQMPPSEELVMGKHKVIYNGFSGSGSDSIQMWGTEPSGVSSVDSQKHNDLIRYNGDQITIIETVNVEGGSQLVYCNYLNISDSKKSAVLREALTNDEKVTIYVYGPNKGKSCLKLNPEDTYIKMGAQGPIRLAQYLEAKAPGIINNLLNSNVQIKGIVHGKEQ